MSACLPNDADVACGNLCVQCRIPAGVGAGYTITVIANNLNGLAFGYLFSYEAPEVDVVTPVRSVGDRSYCALQLHNPTSSSFVVRSCAERVQHDGLRDPD